MDFNNIDSAPDGNKLFSGQKGKNSGSEKSFFDARSIRDTKKTHSFWNILTVQCILTVSCAISVVLFSTFVKDGFAIFKKEYDLLKNAVNMDTASEKIRGFFNSLRPLQPDGSEDIESSSNNVSRESESKDDFSDDDAEFSNGDNSERINVLNSKKNEILFSPVNASFSPVPLLPPRFGNVPYSGKITSTFGWRKSPITGKREFHFGVDIAGALKDPIRAAGDGRVVFIGYSDKMGKHLEIEHGGGLTTRYAHCDNILVSEDNFVKKGQTIARMGSTGISTGTHLHFETVKNGVWVDPAQMFQEYDI
ncbi:MAG: M23 family metallopeptidase [Oscillospiraceae bacterium]|nr:M23 family metallopeptidase [Oscillospiraceae bacterium]